MAVTLATYALDSLDNVKAAIGVADDDRDDQLTLRINQWSQAILRETGREFVPAVPADDDDDPVDRTVEYRVGHRQMWLMPYEVRSVTGITFNPGADDEKVLEVGDWQLEPFTNPDGVYDRVTLTLGAVYRNYCFDRVPCTVTARWGWPAVPSEILTHLHDLVGDSFRRKQNVFVDAVGQYDGSPVSVPYAVREQLCMWKRPYLGGA
jgi:hypothetical protein